MDSDEDLRASVARLRSELEAERERFAAELARKNQELEAFGYSVSHDLRAPLRSIDGFSLALLEDYGDTLDEQGKDYLRRVRAAAQRLGELIDDLLVLSRVGRADLLPESSDLSALARAVLQDLQRAEPARTVRVVVEPELRARADRRLIRLALQHLLGNAWKFTGRRADAEIAFGAAERQPGTYYVRDNGDGFDMGHADRLFRPFARLHREAEFPGRGIGLAVTRRIIERHGGRIRAEALPGAGCTVTFTLPAEPPAAS